MEIDKKNIFYEIQNNKEFLNERTKRKIGFTVACVNEFANKHNLSVKV